MWSRADDVCTFCGQLNLVMCKSYVGGTGFEDINESWISAESCHCERPGGTFGKGTAFFAVEAPILKSS